MKRSSRRFADDGGRRAEAGFTIVEAMVASVVSLLILAAALALALAGRRLYEADGARIELNEGLRVGKSFLVTDLRQAGERLPKNFPAIEIIDGASGAPDTLIVRRNLLDTVLRSCRKVEAAEAFIHVAENEAVAPAVPPPGCAEVPDGDSDGWPDNLQAWREYRIAQGTTVLGYLYDPVAGVGEFFEIKDETYNGTLVRIEVDSPAWSRTYDIPNQCSVYVIEEHRYALNGDTMQVVLNGDTANPTNIAQHLTDFQAVANFVGPVQQTSLGPADNWSTLETIGVFLQGENQLANETMTRLWSADVVPRNVLSE